MKKALAMPQITASVSPTRVEYEVKIDKSGNDWWPEEYRFSIDALDGTVSINDNEFSSKDVAAKALKAMSDFLSKK
jgi:hypothetical protein